MEFSTTTRIDGDPVSVDTFTSWLAGFAEPLSLSSSLSGQLVFFTAYKGLDGFFFEDPNNPENLQPATNNPLIGSYYEAAFSPDGSQIAYTQTTSEDNITFKNNIFVANTSGFSKPIQLTYNEQSMAPAWSPDGKRITFLISANSYSGDIYVMNSDGSGVSQLTHSGSARSPVWAPDGRTIAYADGDIWLVNADGTNRNRLSTGGSVTDDPAFSPDGSKIVFTDLDAVYVINTDGSGQINLINSEPGNIINNTKWSYDGQQIAYDLTKYDPEYSTNVFTMNSDGTNQVQISYALANTSYPFWYP